ncbi:hypothetical protein H4S07_002234, partial [Coemansia furcata]
MAEAMTKFNAAHMKERVTIEQVFGVWKNMFRSLKSLPLEIGDNKGLDNAIKWIHVTALLYNFVHPTDEELVDIVYYDKQDFDLELEHIDGADSDSDSDTEP